MVYRAIDTIAMSGLDYSTFTKLSPAEIAYLGVFLVDIWD